MCVAGERVKGRTLRCDLSLASVGRILSATAALVSSTYHNCTNFRQLCE